jgi:Fe2+ or Zn2+ uptake regulation protein
MNDKNTIRRLTLKILSESRGKGRTAQSILKGMPYHPVPVTLKQVYEALSFWAEQDCVDVNQADYKKSITFLKKIAKGDLHKKAILLAPAKYFLLGRAKLITSVFSK